MKLVNYVFFISALLISGISIAQEEEAKEKESGHYNNNRFKQLYEEFSTPNGYRSASGAPGPDYYQQQADYVMDIELDDENARLYGFETITYTNNSPDKLEYLWVQLDQNVRSRDSKSPLISTSGATPANRVSSFVSSYMGEGFDGGFRIQEVKGTNGVNLDYTINMTMMRVEMPNNLRTGEQFTLSIKWWYNINNHNKDWGRSGYEEFKDGNRAYVIAQFFWKLRSEYYGSCRSYLRCYWNSSK
jgi:hypothetical protein